MEKYQGLAIYVTLGLIVGAALSETFLKVQWSAGLLAIIALPMSAVFAEKAANAIKARATEKALEDLKAQLPQPEAIPSVTAPTVTEVATGDTGTGEGGGS